MAAFVAGLALPPSAHAQLADAGVAPKESAAVPDARLQAMTGKQVRVELEGSPAVSGELVGFEEKWVTLLVPQTGAVVWLPRTQLLGLTALDPPPAPAQTAAATPQKSAHERERIVGVHFGLSVSLAVDAQWRRFYGFVNGNVLFPLTTVTGNAAWMAVAIGAGATVPLVNGHRWYADMFAEALPLYLGGPYTYLGVGAGFGLRYAAVSGFTFAVKVPVLGYALRTGRSPYGYDPSFRPGYGFGYYYLAGLMGLPLVSVGYRF
jgi:hypothetical protein